MIRHGALQAFLAVVAGAFGAHGLKERLSEYSLGIWHTAVTYHMWHALAILLLALLPLPAAAARRAHWCFSAGLLLFSGSLYALALSDLKALGMITPLGGLAFLAGWLLIAWSAPGALKRG